MVVLNKFEYSTRRLGRNRDAGGGGITFEDKIRRPWQITLKVVLRSRNISRSTQKQKKGGCRCEDGVPWAVKPNLAFRQHFARRSSPGIFCFVPACSFLSTRFASNVCLTRAYRMKFGGSQLCGIYSTSSHVYQSFPPRSHFGDFWQPENTGHSVAVVFTECFGSFAAILQLRRNVRMSRLRNIMLK